MERADLGEGTGQSVGMGGRKSVLHRRLTRESTGLRKEGKQTKKSVVFFFLLQQLSFLP